MSSPLCESPTLDEIQSALQYIRQCSSRLYKRTPLISNWKDLGDLETVSEQCRLHFKLENTQVTGSYKVRGILNQLRVYRERVPDWTNSQLCTLSAGNYGKTFAFLTADFKRRLVVMPSLAPANRQAAIERYGAEVERVESTRVLDRMNEIVAAGELHYMHSINDINLIIGHGSLGLEILEDVPEPDVILVPCGGGALLAGVAASIKLSLGSGSRCRVYGVEPEGANTMWQSFQRGEPVVMPTAKSLAAGLAPPYAGDPAYHVCRRHVDDILVVPDSAIARAVTQLYGQGLVVEPSGAVGYAALSLGLVPDVAGRDVVVVFSGGNVSPDEIAEIFKMAQI